MHKVVIKFVDYDGNPREEEHFFNMNQAEVVEWLMTSGDYTLDKVLLKLSKERNGKEIMATFKDLIYRSYGEKSLDGRRFIKTEEVKANFMETEAYSKLFMELVTDAKKAADFVNAIIPKELADEVTKIMAEHPEGIPDEMKDYLQSSQKISEDLTPLAPVIPIQQ